MGHRLTATYPAPSGWRAVCSCGHVARGPRPDVAVDGHEAHIP